MLRAHSILLLPFPFDVLQLLQTLLGGVPVVYWSTAALTGVRSLHVAQSDAVAVNRLSATIADLAFNNAFDALQASNTFLADQLFHTRALTIAGIMSIRSWCSKQVRGKRRQPVLAGIIAAGDVVQGRLGMPRRGLGQQLASRLAGRQRRGNAAHAPSSA
jgi:hypothetical protein